MAASAKRSAIASDAGLAVRRVLRSGRLMLVLAWFAFSFSTVAHAECAVHIDSVHSGGTSAPVAASGYAAPTQHSEPEGDHPDCQQLLEAGTAPPPTWLLPSPSGKIAVPPLPPPLKPLVAIRGHGIAPNWHPPPPAQRALYLFTSRLLI